MVQPPVKCDTKGEREYKQYEGLNLAYQNNRKLGVFYRKFTEMVQPPVKCDTKGERVYKQYEGLNLAYRNNRKLGVFYRKLEGRQSRLMLFDGH